MKHLFQLSLLLLALLLPTTALAHDFEVDGVYYKINGTEATVTYRGTSSWNHNTYSGDVTIPATVTYGGTTYSVTSISYAAFYNCSDLTSITIPNSVTTIGNSAFYGCSNLTSIVVANGNTTYDSRGNCNAIIETASNTLVLGCKNTVIPNSVISIGGSAFSSCSGLISVTIPNSVISIGGSAFSGCSSLTSIDIPNSVTSISDDAFMDCSGLISMKVENGNPNYDSRDNCNAIIETATNTLISGCQYTIIPNSVTSIGGVAFVGCSGLSSINIPSSVISIGGNAFYGCSGLTSVHITDLAAWCNIDFYPNDFIFDSNPLGFAHHLFLNGEEIKDLVIPNTVTTIKDGAFIGCSGLTSITISNSVTSIGWLAFSGCTNLASLAIGNSVTSIEPWAILGSQGQLTKITVASDNPNYDSRNNCNAIIETATNTLISGCMNTVIPNSVTSIGNFAFYGCSGLTSITIANSEKVHPILW